MHQIPIYQIDAFAPKSFGGNPAAVCPLPAFLSDELMQAIALENNLSETAFLVPDGEVGAQHPKYHLRWFTPAVEVDLCGHATLAAGYVVLNHLQPDAETVSFATRSGTLRVSRSGARLSMDLPNLMPKQIEAQDGLEEALGVRALEVQHRDRDLLIRIESLSELMELAPDFRALKQFAPYGFLVTTEGGDLGDFVSRCFFPNHGIDEDPVTGSAHSVLAPYWARELGKDRLHARQLSQRQGELWIDVSPETVTLVGEAVETMRGTLFVPQVA